MYVAAMRSTSKYIHTGWECGLLADLRSKANILLWDALSVFMRVSFFLLFYFVLFRFVRFCFGVSGPISESSLSFHSNEHSKYVFKWYMKRAQKSLWLDHCDKTRFFSSLFPYSKFFHWMMRFHIALFSFPKSRRKTWILRLSIKWWDNTSNYSKIMQ